MDSFIKISLHGVKDPDVVLGLLNDYPFTGFEEGDSLLVAYMASRDWNELIKTEIDQLLGPFIDETLIELVPFENWNQQWEQNYPEVEIDEFCRIYAPFHRGPAQKFNYEILISPQMAFGTGHHNTTQMMIRLMSHMPEKIQDQRVLDFGAGSGILAILAYKMGAAHVDAVEIDPYAFQNLKENILLNKADWVSAWEGGLDQLPDTSKYDVILANVTRGIILHHARDFFERLNPGGRIIISGILDTDHDEVHQAYIKTGFFGLESMKIGKWSALCFGRKERKPTL